MSIGPITGAILSGGANTRIAGTPAAFLRMGEEQLIKRQIRVMREVCDEIIVVTNTPRPFFSVVDADVRIITDFFTGCGPLGGMHAALHLARYPLIWVAGGDLPFLSAEAARRLGGRMTDTCDGVVPVIGGQPVPLHGIYRQRAAPAAAHLLTNGETALSAFLGRIRWRGLPADGWVDEAAPYGFHFRIQGQRDYDTALRLLGETAAALQPETSETGR